LQGRVKASLEGWRIDFSDHIQHVTVMTNDRTMILEGKHNTRVFSNIGKLTKCAARLGPDFKSGCISPDFIPSSTSHIVIGDSVTIGETRPSEEHTYDLDTEICSQANLLPHHKYLRFQELRNRCAEVIICS